MPDTRPDDATAEGRELAPVRSRREWFQRRFDPTFAAPRLLIGQAASGGVAARQAFQHGAHFIGLVDLHGLEAAGQRRVLLDMLAIFRPGGGGDGAQGAARQGRLQQVGRIAGTGRYPIADATGEYARNLGSDNVPTGVPPGGESTLSGISLSSCMSSTVASRMIGPGRPSESLARSADLTQGHRGRIFLIYLLLFAVFVYLLNDKIQHGPDEADLTPGGKLALQIAHAGLWASPAPTPRSSACSTV